MNSNIYVPDALRQSVEKASGGQQTVIYTNKKYPSYMTIIPRINCEELSDDLGVGTHPAFLVGNREVSEIMIGSYLSTIIDGQALSLPYQDPHTSINHDHAREACFNCGPGFHMTTNWESALIGLWCIKNNIPRGNTDYGKSHLDSKEFGLRCRDGKTLTGSGPNSWSHNGSMYGIMDIVGNVWEHQDGLKIVNGDIVMPLTNDFNLTESEWVNTKVKFDFRDGNIIVSDKMKSRNWDSSDFRDIGIKDNYDIPSFIKQALLCPSNSIKNLDNSINLGRVWIDNTEGEFVPFRFGDWGIGAHAGVAALYLRYLRSRVHSDIGFRVAYIA